MKVTLKGNKCIVQREKGDRGFYGQAGSAWGGMESNLLHHVKLKINSKGNDIIKKRMHKDGHLVDELRQYLRARNIKKLKPGDLYCIYDKKYNIRNSAEDYNAGAEVHLAVERIDIPDLC
jgi:hypothetical protein